LLTDYKKEGDNLLGFYVFAAVLCFVFFFFSGEGGKTAKLATRLENKHDAKKRETPFASIVNLAHKGIRFVAAKIPPSHNTQKRLLKAGIKIEPQDFYVFKIVGAVLPLAFLAYSRQLPRPCS